MEQNKRKALEGSWACGTYLVTSRYLEMQGGEVWGGRERERETVRKRKRERERERERQSEREREREIGSRQIVE